MAGMTSKTEHGDGGRRGLQITLGVLSAIPLVSGARGLLSGPSALPGPTGQVGATLDSEYRFVSAYWLAAAPVIWSALPQVERRGRVLRGVLGAAVAGGAGRLISMRRAGRPHPAMVAAIGLELVALPGVLAWQSVVAGAARER